MWTPGHSGQALEFNGVNQWADTNASILDTTTDYSVAAWVRLDQLGRFATAVSQDRSDGVSEFFLQYSAQDNRFAFSTPTVRAVGPIPQTGVWYHLVGEYDSVHSQIRLYVNGQAAGTAPYCPGRAAAGHTVLGRALYNKAQVDFWHGSLDSVHVYDRALSPAEIDQLYRSDT
ncbi:LamG domain-containing protein [Kutzneria sp. 744]|uniref:LamG domain-containing protein n=1 Tax=Kutzneria sp. (strain 744) TaxID=345341 RepID=UPI0004AC5CB6|nr:LamG domain-containing protein [Kutzneria sp. 744]